jgi:hypothetical protein
MYETAVQTLTEPLSVGSLTPLPQPCTCRNLVLLKCGDRFRVKLGSPTQCLVAYDSGFVWLKATFPRLEALCYPRNDTRCCGRIPCGIPSLPRKEQGSPYFAITAHVTAKSGRLAGVGKDEDFVAGIQLNS